MLQGFKDIIEKRLQAVPNPDYEGLEFWRHKIYYSVSLALVILGFIAYVPSFMLSVYHKMWSVALWDTLAYLLVLILYFFNSIRFTIRVYGLLFIIYLLGVVLLILLGPMGAGIVWLFAFPVLASILNGFRSALFSIIINFITLAVFGVLLMKGTLSNTMMSLYNVEAWTIVSINFICLNVLVSVPISVLIKGLEITLREEHKAKALLKNEQVSLSKNNIDLKKINNDLDNFIYTASHDLKAPISNIEGLVTLLLHELGEHEQGDVKNTITLIRKSIDRFKQTINALTDVSKAQRGGIEQWFEVISIDEVFDEVKSNINELLLKNQPTIYIDFNVKEVTYSRKDLTSILYNLLSNAIKYCAKDRPCEVWLRTEMKDGYFVLTVKDNGMGMQPDYKDKLFKMFKRLHDHVEGTGIGLYIIKRMVENYEGKIEVQSQLNEGTEFRVFLKVVD